MPKVCQLLLALAPMAQTAPGQSLATLVLCQRRKEAEQQVCVEPENFYWPSCFSLNHFYIFFLFFFFLPNGKMRKKFNLLCQYMPFQDAIYAFFITKNKKGGKKTFVKILNIFTGILGALQDYMTALEQCVAYINYLHKQIGSWDKS